MAFLVSGDEEKFSTSLRYQEAHISSDEEKNSTASRYQVAHVAGGCFWGVELFYQRTRGVVGTKVGYTQGDTVNPTYQQVCTGETNHREAVMVIYDVTVVSYEELVQSFLQRWEDTHSSPTLGLDSLFGHDDNNIPGQKLQYQYGIYFHTDEQRRIAKRMLQRHQKRMLQRHAGAVNGAIELRPAAIFYPGGEHQQYLFKGGQSARKGAKELIQCHG